MAIRGEVQTRQVSNPNTQYIRWLSELNKNSGSIAGGKGANLAEMFNSKFPVPPAFVITTKAYFHFIESSKIKEKIFGILDKIDVDNISDLEENAAKIREIIVQADLPQDLINEINEAYENISIDKKSLESASSYALNILKHGIEPVFVAVRSSATTEDLDDSSFAGQQESYLNIKGNNQLIDAVKKVLASLFTARAIYYRKKRGFSKEKFALAVVVQKMIDSDKSGVIFSSNPVQTNNNILIEAVYGLGEGIVSGKIKPDGYEVSRNLKILDKKIADKKIALTRNSQGDTEQINLTPGRSKSQVLEEHEINTLANYALKIEEHYEKPQDIEFAIESGEVYIVQSRPITTNPKEQGKKVEGRVILTGLGASQGIASGKVKIVHDLSHLEKVEKGDILVTEMTNPDMVVTMQRSAGIITDEGGITSHAAIVSREMGIPAVVGTGQATKILKDNQIVTVDGFTGQVYEGQGETKLVEIKPIIPTNTKIKVILDLPDFADRAALTKCEAVGLLRLEGIIASSGKHPLYYVKQNKLEDYSKVLENGISKISEHFKEIWIRSSDIRSDEYSNLEGAPKKIEANPMLGMHGIRFSLKNPDLLKAEFQAIKNCTKKYPDRVYGIMIPQVISVEEIIETKKLAEEIKLDNVKFGIMVETPAAALIIKDLIKAGIDFASIGSNDLTQYTLAIDRGNESVQYLYNELHPAMLNAIKRVIRTCNEEGIESSICGQAGSNKEMVKYLIEYGITSISANADAAYDISIFVSELERQIEEKTKEQIKGKKEENKKEMILITEKTEKVQTYKEEIPQEIIVEEAKTNKISDNNIEKNLEEKQKEKIKEEEEERGYEDHIPAYTAGLLENLDIDELEEIKEIKDASSKLEEITDEDADEILDIF